VELPLRTPLPAEAVPMFDKLARRTARLLNVPVALISLIDVDGQALPGAIGLAEPWASERWTPLELSFCRHVVETGEPLVVANAHDDSRVADNPAIQELGVIAYAGVPLRSQPPEDGDLIPRPRAWGALAAIDHKPRIWSAAELTELDALAAECSQVLRSVIHR
jgi:GAF domain-containing protein